MTTLYVAGPMSGLPQFNYPAFDAAAAVLRDSGYTVISPAEMDSPQVRAASLASTTGSFADLAETDETWGDFLSRDVKLVADRVDGVVLLDNWHRSRGARLEAFVCLNVGKPVYRLGEGGSLIEIDRAMVMSNIYINTLSQGDTSRYENSNA